MDIIESIIWGFGGFLLGAIPMAILIFVIDPYLRAKILGLITGKTHFVAEIVMDNMEAITKVLKTSTPTFKIDENEYKPDKSLFYRKFGVPVQQFHYGNMKPMAPRGEDVIVTRYFTPAGLSIPIEFDWQASPEEIKRSKGEPIHVKKIMSVKAEDIIPQVGGWTEFRDADIAKYAPVFTPAQFAAFMQAEHAYAITNAAIQKQREIQQARQYALYAAILAGIAVIIGLVNLYYLMNAQNGIDSNHQLLMNMNQTIVDALNASKPVILGGE